MRNKAAYFAEQLYTSMKGMGTNDRQLIRVVVTRCEVDMVQIKQEFQRNYGKTLESFIVVRITLHNNWSINLCKIIMMSK